MHRRANKTSSGTASRVRSDEMQGITPNLEDEEGPSCAKGWKGKKRSITRSKIISRSHVPTRRPLPSMFVVSMFALVYLVQGMARGSKLKGIPSDDEVFSEARAQEYEPSASSLRSPDRLSSDVTSDSSQSSDSQDEDEYYMLEYQELREEFDTIFPETHDAKQRRLSLAEELRRLEYRPIGDFDNGVKDCPLYPPHGYPKQWRIVDLIDNWNPEDVTPRRDIYQGICVFDYEADYEKARNYRNAHVPFVIRNDPQVLRTVERWNHPEYVQRMMGSEERGVDYSKSQHFMYYDGDVEAPPGWEEPTDEVDMTYSEWFSKATKPTDEQGSNEGHWYYTIKACGPDRDCTPVDKCEFLLDEMPFFQPKDSIYKFHPPAEEGINCRFGMTGVIAECHYDVGENMIAVLQGERRYILSSPEQCHGLALHPEDHPSGRHSAVDWSNPDLKKHPEFENAHGNEIILQAGDVLYVPSYWFHFIVNLGFNAQCNSRSEELARYSDQIRKCGYADP